MHLSSRVTTISASLTLAITAKAKKMKADGVDIVSFGSGEPDFDTPPYIKKAAIEAIQKGFTKYTPASGTDELKKTICEKFCRDNNLTYEPSQIVVSCGAKHAIYNILQAICDRDDEVLIPAPYWLSYPEMVRLAGARPLIIETDEKTNFKISPERLNDSVTKNTKALILNSPSNPTGSVYNADELKKIADIALRYNILVLSDEIYEKIIFGGKRHISIATLDKNIFKNTVVVNGVSKSFSMTGWRIGYLASCNDSLINAIKNIQSHSTSNPTSISQAAAVAALSESHETVKDMVAQFESRRDYIVKRIKDMKGLSCVTPEGAFYVFCKIDKKSLSGMRVAEGLLEDVNVAVIPGKAFGSDRHIRLSFATDMENITKGMDRISQWFKRV